MPSTGPGAPRPLSIALLPILRSHHDDLPEAVRRGVALGVPDEPSARALCDEAIRLMTAPERAEVIGGWWAIHTGEGGDHAVGSCGLKAEPDAHGVVEIAYYTFPAFQGRGVARAMVAAMIETLRGRARLVIAHTLREKNASRAVLRASGFSFAGPVIDPDDGPVWRWERRLDGG